MNTSAFRTAGTALDRAPAGGPPLIAHVLFHFGVGGLENGVVNLINSMPYESFRHAIVCIRGTDEFHQRLRRDDVEVIALGKGEGVELGGYARAWRELLRLRPAIVHTRNLAALEMQVPAAMARVPCRVHSEHGREGADLRGDYRPYNLIRRSVRPLVHRYVAVSRDLQRWLTETIRVRADRIEQIYNGVDTERFLPRGAGGDQAALPASLNGGTELVVGAVGRMAPIKDHVTLIRAVAHLAAIEPAARKALRLVIVGDGPCLLECEREIASCGIGAMTWLPGAQSDVPRLLRAFDVFCLTSINEGINNTILEAMSSGLPVIATRVGGNPELIDEGACGMLVPPSDPIALAQAIRQYWHQPDMRQRHGEAARRRVEAQFSLRAMTERYLAMYKHVLARRGLQHV